jgi:hypothetical protein
VRRNREIGAECVRHIASLKPVGVEAGVGFSAMRVEFGVNVGLKMNYVP